MINTTQNNEVLFIASYPPRVCGIATYSKDLINAIHKKFSSSFSIKVCALEENGTSRNYPEEVKYLLKSSDPEAYMELAQKINNDEAIKMVFIQHEFGLFGGDNGEYLLQLLYFLEKPVSITFHTVLPSPDKQRKKIVQAITNVCDKIIVMTKNATSILKNEYNISKQKISIIPHGTHIVPWKSKQQIKEAYQLENHLVLSTFGLLSSNKSIETALDALPKIVKQFPEVLYLVLGKTHPGVVQHEGEVYREFLKEKVRKLGLQNNVSFVNKYLSLPELLEYLSLTDIYLFTSKDPHQAVSGTFAYAMSSACPIISTPIPHAKEMLRDNTGIIIDFQNSEQLAKASIKLLENNNLRDKMGRNAFHQTRHTIWENTAIPHAFLFNKHLNNNCLTYDLPKINLQHIYSLTDEVGMIQFSDICEPDIDSGYTLDDNARAMIAVCMQYDATKNMKDVVLIEIYLNFIEFCQQPNGAFLNYVDKNKMFHAQNDCTNLEDSNGRAIWALGTLIAYEHVLPQYLVKRAKEILIKSLPRAFQIESPRSIAFIIKGLYFYYQNTGEEQVKDFIDVLASKLLDKYQLISDTNWRWYEEYLTYANSTLPEAMLYAYIATHKSSYKIIAHTTFEFLLSHLFVDGKIKVVSNNGWFHKNNIPNEYGEQPIDVSYTIQALELFYKVFKDEAYRKKLEIAFSWFLGNNHLKQVMYNPITGGCYDGLEEHSINLNQGAESTVCYLIARLIIKKIRKTTTKKRPKLMQQKKQLVYSTHRSLPKRIEVQKKSIIVEHR